MKCTRASSRAYSAVVSIPASQRVGEGIEQATRVRLPLRATFFPLLFTGSPR